MKTILKRKQNYEGSFKMGNILRVAHGEKIQMSLIVQDEDFVGVDLTGSILKLTVKRNLKDSDESAVMVKTTAEGEGITLTDPLKGSAEIQINPSDLDGVEAGSFYYDLSFVNEEDTERVLLIRADLFIIEERVSDS